MGLKARTAIGSVPRAEANSKAPTISAHSASALRSPPAPSADRRRKNASANARTVGARSEEVRSPIKSIRLAPTVISCLVQALLQRVELRSDLAREAVAELLEELADGGNLLLPRLHVNREDLFQLLVGDVEPLRVERLRRRDAADRRVAGLGGVVAAAEDPLEHARVLAEAGPQEGAGLEVL